MIELFLSSDGSHRARIRRHAGAVKDLVPAAKAL